MQVSPIQCLACTRLDPATEQPTRCTAFPDGIPPEIGIYAADHRKPIGGERDGLLFEQAGSDEARDAFTWWQRTFGSR